MQHTVKSILERISLSPEVHEHLRGAMIYIVDDDPNLLGILAMAIEKIGMSSTACAGPNDLLSILNPSDRGCILVDYHMREMNGLQLIRRLKEKQITLPIIMISGRGGMIDTQEVVAAGAVAFLQKPFDLAELMDLICRNIPAHT